MTEDEFWYLIEGAALSRGGTIEELADALGAAGPKAVRDFGAVLQAKVAALVTDAHVAAVARVDGFVAAGAGSDHVDYVSAAVVAAGRATYHAVLADPALMAANWDEELGDDLIALPAQLFGELSEEPYVDQASGGSVAVFLHVVGTVKPPDMPTWRKTLSAYGEWIFGHAEIWRTWWSPSQREELEVYMEIEGPDPQRFKIRAGKKRVEVDFVRSNDRLSKQEQAQAAEQDARWVLEQIRAKFQLQTLPPLPPANEVRSELKKLYQGMRF